MKTEHTVSKTVEVDGNVTVDVEKESSEVHLDKTTIEPVKTDIEISKDAKVHTETTVDVKLERTGELPKLEI